MTMPINGLPLDQFPYPPKENDLCNMVNARYLNPRNRRSTIATLNILLGTTMKVGREGHPISDLSDFEKVDAYIQTPRNKYQKRRRMYATLMLHASLRIGFETDVKNDYFCRKLLPGKLQIHLNGLFDESNVASIVGTSKNGVLTVVLNFDQSQLQPKIKFEFIFEINDETVFNPFINICKVRLEKLHESNIARGKGKERSSNNTNQGWGGQQSAELPNVIPIDKESWSSNSTI
jgi:hypothetical protein